MLAPRVLVEPPTARLEKAVAYLVLAPCKIATCKHVGRRAWFPEPFGFCPGTHGRSRLKGLGGFVGERQEHDDVNARRHEPAGCGHHPADTRVDIDPFTDEDLLGSRSRALASLLLIEAVDLTGSSGPVACKCPTLPFHNACRMCRVELRLLAPLGSGGVPLVVAWHPNAPVILSPSEYTQRCPALLLPLYTTWGFMVLSTDGSGRGSG